MAAQTRQAAPAVAPAGPTLDPALARGAGRSSTRGNAAAQESLGTADPPVARAQDARSQVIEAYANRLWDVVGELMLLDDGELVAKRARAVIGQATEVHVAILAGETVEVPLLPKYPEGDQGGYPAAPFPPAWIQPSRMLLKMAGGTGASPRFQPDGPWTLENTAPTPAVPWAGELGKLKEIGREPADYGVNGYQTQSNNLAAPEATCNGTSLAMVLERLGYTRDDLLRTIEAKLKRAQVEADLRARNVPPAEQRRQLAEFDPSCVKLADNAWKNRVLQYLRAENQRGAGYQRPRGRTSDDPQLQAWAGEFKDNAGIDDLALLLMDMLHIERTAVNAGNNPATLVGAVHDGSGTHTHTPKPSTERIDAGVGWTKARATLKEVLDEGGAAMLSIRHKGAGKSGTHIVAVQAVEADGLTIDDPYGRARSDYSAARPGDAYAKPGSTRAASGLRNQVQGLDDWKRTSTVTAEETRGEASHWTDQMVRDSWTYLMLFRRGGRTVPAP